MTGPNQALLSISIAFRLWLQQIKAFICNTHASNTIFEGISKCMSDIARVGCRKEDKEDFDTRSKLIKTLHTEYGEKLVDSLVRAAVTTLPSYTYHDIGDVIHECLQHDRVVQY